jgi:hypothetical protein
MISRSFSQSMFIMVFGYSLSRQDNRAAVAQCLLSRMLLTLAEAPLKDAVRHPAKTSMTSVNQVKSLRTQPKGFSLSFRVEVKADQFASLS